MFCFQCQETAKNKGCSVKGVCGKPEETANLQDLLIYVLKGIAIYGEKGKEVGILDKETGLFIAKALFSTITNANWDNERFVDLIKEGLKRREALKNGFLAAYKENMERILTNSCMIQRPGTRVMWPSFMKRQKRSAFWQRKMRMSVLSGSFSLLD